MNNAILREVVRTTLSENFETGVLSEINSVGTKYFMDLYYNSFKGCHGSLSSLLRITRDKELESDKKYEAILKEIHKYFNII